MRKINFILCLFASTIFAQKTDWVKWEKSTLDYAEKHNFREKQNFITEAEFPEILFESAIYAYRVFISDVDGDNCPFFPSCSHFLEQSVKQTNLPQGVLMFFDRFTRDMNIFNRNNKYPRYDSQHLFDPVELYTLDETLIKYLPLNVRINSE